MTAVAQTAYLAGRDVRALLRQPWYVAITLIQPLIWLLLFGALFERVADLPGFTGSYMDYLAPGMVVMTAMFSAGWSGMATIEDIDRGVSDRMLVSPVSRGALIAGRVAQSALSIAVQALIIVAIALVAGATFPGGVVGVLVLTGVAVLLGAAFAAFSNGIALVTRQEESLIGMVQFLVLPLSFLSTAYMLKPLLPDWIQTATEYNPVDWAVEAGRSATSANPDWGLIAADTGLLLALALLCGWFATRAFRSYQRSV
jgi:ABC-2 type transport system permease protein